jgi:hypothetical protein
MIYPNETIARVQKKDDTIIITLRDKTVITIGGSHSTLVDYAVLNVKIDTPQGSEMIKVEAWMGDTE